MSVRIKLEWLRTPTGEIEFTSKERLNKRKQEPNTKRRPNDDSCNTTRASDPEQNRAYNNDAVHRSVHTAARYYR